MADLGAVGQNGLDTERSGLYLDLEWDNNGAQKGLLTQRSDLYVSMPWSNIGADQALRTRRNNIPSPMDETMLNGYIAEIRLYEGVKTLADLMSIPGTTSDAIDSSLKFYVKCLSKDVNEVVPGSIAPYDLIAPNDADVIVTDVYPPLPYGTSTNVKRFIVNATAPCSLKFPLVPPDDVNFALVVSWIDEEGVFNQRMLWNAIDGGANDAVVDIEPFPANYNGEPLPATFYLDAYNVDGLDDATLAADFTLYLSLTTQPIDSHDHTAQVDTTPTGDTTLAHSFPLTPFPLTFEEQQDF